MGQPCTAARMAAPSTAANVAANVGGRACSILVQMLAVPLQVRLLGHDAYGLVGFMVAVQGLFAVLDLGISGALSRDVARLTAIDGDNQPARDSVRTCEAFYWGTAAILGATLFLGAGYLSHSWLHTGRLPAATAQSAIELTALSFALQWPVTLYAGVLRGAQQMVRLNAILSAEAIVRAGGSVVVLVLTKGSVAAFFWWQVLVSLGQVAALIWLVGHVLPLARGERPRFDRSVLDRLWRFAVGLTVLALTGMAMTQLDKVVISRMLPLASVGYYAIAGTAVGLLRTVPGTVALAVGPRLVVHMAAGDLDRLALVYAKLTRTITYVAAGTGWAIGLFGADILRLWTRSAVIADSAGLAMSILALGTMLEAITGGPYNLLLAAGQTRFLAALHSAITAATVPLLLVLTARYGLSGAAVPWLVVQVVRYIAIPLHTHRSILRGTAGWWFVRGTLPFVALGAGCFGLARLAASWMPAGPLWIAAVAAGGALYVGLADRLLPGEYRVAALVGGARRFARRAAA